MTATATTIAAEQYTQYAERTQKALLNAFDIWTTTVREAAAHLPKPAHAGAETERAVDEAVDFAEKLLAVQRAYAHDVLRATTTTVRRVPGFAGA
ncbi:MAG TPA: hypothetical protein VHI11_01155 [Jiangellaceae bacterium]|nr:hypothetical protein [Jiangellaceae bacterium]